MTAMESEGRWPTDNAIEWIARFVQKKEQEIPNGDGYWARWSRKENLEMIAEIKYYLGVFKRLRELDLHLISGDLKGFERAIETMRGMPGDSFESIAALLADGHRIQ